MKKKNSIRTLATISLLGTFLLTYFMDLTGLELHQYLGVAAALIAVFHLITHWNWVRSITIRLFSKIPLRPKLYYVLDLSLFLGIIVITITGILISTWLEIAPAIYPLILSIHIYSSIAALVVLGFKLGLHWKFFVKKIRSVRESASIETGTLLPENQKKGLSRREALLTIGSISLVGSLGLIRAISAATIKPSVSLPNSKVSTATAQQQANLFPEEPPLETQSNDSQKKRRKHGAKDEGEEATPPQAVEQTPVPQESNPFLPSAESTPENCVAHCPEGCAFPGKCRRYIDENNNQLCDLGECL